MAWLEPLLLLSSSAMRWSKFSEPTAAKAASIDVDCAYAPRRCAHAFRTTGDLSCKCLDASRRAFRRVFSPAPAVVTCFEEAHAVSALSAASRTAGDVESRQHVAPSVLNICVAGPLGSLGQHEASARPDAWQAAALHEGSGSSVNAFFNSVSWRSMAEVATSLDLRGTDKPSRRWRGALDATAATTRSETARNRKRDHPRHRKTEATRVLMIGRRFKRVGVGDRKTGSQNVKSSSSTFVVRGGDVAPQQRRVDALDAGSFDFRACH